MATLQTRAAGTGLVPVRAALLAQAQADANRVTLEAQETVADALAAAGIEARKIRDAAHAEALEQARLLSAAEESHGRRMAREVELAARREAYDALVDEARGEVRRLLDDPEVLALLTELARRQEGPDAQVTRTDDGVVVAEGARRVDFSVIDLADQAIADLLRSREQS
jgi:hypothetical protein